MFWINTKRIVKSGFVSFWRNGFVSLSSVLIMTLTLFTLGGIMFAGALLDSSLDQIKAKVDVNVYFVPTAEEDSVLALQKKLEALPEVASVEYVSRDEALENFRTLHANDQITLQALDELGENPLGAILNIKAKEPSQYEGIAKFLDSEGGEGGAFIDKINYYQNKTAIDTLTRMISGGTKIALALTLALIVISILIVFNTIRLAIYIAREEIAVMKLVGASNRFVRGPFIISGIMYGLVSAVITLVFLYPATFWVSNVTATFFSGFSLFAYYVNNMPMIMGVIIGTGSVLGAISSYLAVRKYLRL
ncbi:MAG TPA: permease-like cell division protein FtsX [Candidatus Paceibacterota bacterium]|jgi:cell division transport system permease protein|nr:permease-like cell division protein FtsX [Candidatus Paceibacterota bacterium]